MVFRIYRDEKGQQVFECCQCFEKVLMRPTAGLDIEAHSCLVAETPEGGTHREND